MIDQHFTPDWLADLVSAALPENLRGLAVDPAAGSGALLASLARRGREHLLPVAMDSDPDVVSELRVRHPTWTVSAADSLSRRSRVSSKAWRLTQEMGVEVVLLNPPFSYRGGPSTSVAFGDFSGRLSPAAEFLVMALTELRPRYGIVAIMPDGVVNGQKYESFWEEVRRTHRVRTLSQLNNSSFAGVRASCSLLEIVSREVGEHEEAVNAPDTLNQSLRLSDVIETSGCRCIEVIRGRVPRHRVHAEVGATAPYIHTTHVNGHALVQGTERAPTRLASRGPFVVLPRIGYPKDKVAVVGPDPVVLSDCLIALRPVACSPDDLAGHVRASLGRLARQYTGTGAPYITVDRLTRFLSQAGWHPVVVSASTDRGNCNCSARISRVVESSELSVAS